MVSLALFEFVLLISLCGIINFYSYYIILNTYIHRIHLQTREKVSISNSKEPKITNQLQRRRKTTSDHGGMNSFDPSLVRLVKNTTHEFLPVRIQTMMPHLLIYWGW